MRLQFLLAEAIALLAFSPAVVTAWGVVGHEVVATIAQMFLHDSTEAAVKDILPEWTKGHLAPVAACKLVFHCQMVHYRILLKTGHRGVRLSPAWLVLGRIP